MSRRGTPGDAPGGFRPSGVPDDPILRALREQQAELAGLIVDLEESGWTRASRCEGWTVQDVVAHLGHTNELAVASLTGGFPVGWRSGVPVDEAADAMVVRDRHMSSVEVLARWEASATAMDHAFLQCDLHARVPWVVGELAARTLATTRLSETWIHTGDIAYGLGVELQPGDRLWHIARLAWRTLPYAFGQAGRHLHGPVAFSLRGPRGDVWEFVDDDPVTVIEGEAVDLCLVAARRATPEQTSLRGEGPDAAGVLELMRTYA